MSVTTVFTGPKHQADPLCDELRYRQGVASAFVHPADFGGEYDLRVNIGHKSRALEVLGAILKGRPVPDAPKHEPVVKPRPVTVASKKGEKQEVRPPTVEHLPDRPIEVTGPAVQCALFNLEPVTDSDVLYREYRAYLDECRRANRVADNVSCWTAQRSVEAFD